MSLNEDYPSEYDDSKSLESTGNYKQDDFEQEQDLEEQFVVDFEQEQDLEEQFVVDFEQDDSEMDTKDIRRLIASKFEIILREIDSNKYNEIAEINTEYQRQFLKMAHEIDSEYLHFWKTIGKIGSKIAKQVTPSIDIWKIIQKRMPGVSKNILGTILKAGRKYGMANLIKAVPGIGNIAAVAGPMLANAGIPGLKQVFGNGEVNSDNIPDISQNFANVVDEAMKYMYNNLEIDSDDPLNAQKLAVDSINHALEKFNATPGGILTRSSPVPRKANPTTVPRKIYIYPGQPVTFTFIARK